MSAKSGKILAKSNESIGQLALVTCISFVVLIVVVSDQTQATPLSTITAITDSQQQTGGVNNLENLISDFLKDAGSRLKKSKLNSMRQIKQTLRFGRRSDPLMTPSALSEQLSLENELENGEEQRRLLATALADD